MKKWIVSFLCIALAAALFTGCGDSSGQGTPGDGGSGADGAQGRLVYSNMIDKASQEEAADRLNAAGIESSRSQELFAMVNDYNALVGKLSEYHDGFTDHEGLTVDYTEDTYSKWMDQRNYADANCRITALTLMSGQISLGMPQAFDSFLATDEDAVKNYKLIHFDEQECGRFGALFNPVSVEPTTDSDAVLKAFQSEWAKRGISFKEGPASMVSVLMHSELDNIGYIGHTGVMLEDEQGVLFIEKLAPTMPYQALKFQSREEVKEYLTANYGTMYTEGVSAKPVIIVNDQAL